ncbi:MutT/nudix family protein [Alcanivorax hongdengensis A-11-3]|uniref:MutT/nudix family protein n=1 Tax=Alcanivorax hongdengensis A-11-3 TaxID=1177179 RepID=L0WAW7_9GAMM|nr:NUDIX hydrolase [Alcanivorax hongdengensis]EKF73883.1 MutT/nudix family protein [Alcanivorax hongdengensis A-11-3]
MKTLLCLLLCLLPLAALARSGEAPPCDRRPATLDTRKANAGCLILRGDQVLLVRLRGNDKLDLPGGTREDDELAQCTAHRETWEESGLDVSVGRRLAVMKNGLHVYRCYPHAMPEGTPPVPVSGRNEIGALGWWRSEDIPRDQWRFSYQYDQFKQLLKTLLDRDSR